MTPKKRQTRSTRSANKSSGAPDNSANGVVNTGIPVNEGTHTPPPLASPSADAAAMPPAARSMPADASNASSAAPDTSKAQPSPARLLPASVAALLAAAAVQDTVGEPRRRGRRLRTLTHVKGGLAHLIRELEAGRLEPKAANALTYAYSALAGVMGADVSRELQEMQDTIARVKGARLDA